LSTVGWGLLLGDGELVQMLHIGNVWQVYLGDQGHSQRLGRGVLQDVQNVQCLNSCRTVIV